MATQLQTKQKTLKEELEKEEVDRGVISGIIAEISQYHATLLNHRVEGLLAMKEILTPEQFEKVNNLGKLKMHMGFGDRKHGRGGWGQKQ